MGESSANTIYRILSPTAILGYGFPEQSFEAAMEYKLDLIAVDAGSVDAGPYYLGSSKHYVATAALRRDLTWMIKGALSQKCPCIVGSAGFSGADPQFTDLVNMIKDIISEETDQFVRVAVISADIKQSLLSNNPAVLTSLGRMPDLDASKINSSKIVGQMGIEPIITALEGGAQIIICGRAYDPAVFAADPILKGYDPGIAYHAGKILECGAIACIPGSGSDCLIAEIHRDGHAEFYTPSDKRKTTVASIAAHSLYEKSRPDFFYLPGGCLSIQDTKFSQIDEYRASIRGSRFISAPSSVKLEGSRRIGKRKVSIIPLRDCKGISDDIAVYGRNGVEETESNNDIGMIVLVSSDDLKAAQNVLASIRSTMLHYGYPGRKSTAGNLAFPCSPSDIDTLNNGKPCSFFIAGSRDPIFRKEWTKTQKAVLDHVKTQLPALAALCEVIFISADSEHPVAFIESIDDDNKHSLQLAEVVNNRNETLPAFENINVGDVYEWTIHHLLLEQPILDGLFPVQFSEWHNQLWRDAGKIACNWHYSIRNDEAAPDEKVALTPPHPLKNSDTKVALTDIAHVIRSKNAGINELTFDVLFIKEESYQQALDSGVFTNMYMAKVLALPESDFVGCFHYPIVRAIKVTIHRSCLAGSPGDRDVFGAQQHGRLMGLKIPV